MSKKIKALIVSEDESMRDLFEMVLESEFICEAIKVGNGDRAIEVLKETNDFSLIIFDYYMSDIDDGKIYCFNNDHQKIPLFLFSTGELQDYAVLKDFNRTNELNYFFSKPFGLKDLLAAVQKIINYQVDAAEYVRVDLTHYIKYSKSPAEIYLKLGDNKYTKIIHANEEVVTGKALYEHYLEKDIYDVYLGRNHYNQLLGDIFKHFNQLALNETKARVSYQIAGFNFLVCAEGLLGIGISNVEINKTNTVVHNTINCLLNKPSSQNHIKKLCDNDDYIIGHSLLIMYVAAKICLGTSLNFNSTMTRICGAAFFHDFSLIESDYPHNEMAALETLDDKTRHRILQHPRITSEYLPDNSELIAEIKKIIFEHHELPNGEGYPRKLYASQISPLSCLFILSEQITFCLLRNNFSKKRLQDFLSNIEEKFNQGNFSNFYLSAKLAFKEERFKQTG